jgi:hypothetical protein
LRAKPNVSQNRTIETGLPDRKLRKTEVAFAGPDPENRAEAGIVMAVVACGRLCTGPRSIGRGVDDAYSYAGEHRKDMKMQDAS